MRYTNGKHRKSLRFLAFTHINLPGKCVFSAANSGEYVVVIGKMPVNKRKTSCLQCVNRAVNAGKWFVYLHLRRRKTNEYWDSQMRKRTENVGFSVRKTAVPLTSSAASCERESASFQIFSYLNYWFSIWLENNLFEKAWEINLCISFDRVYMKVY